jgi:hypothetical protein
VKNLRDRVPGFALVLCLALMTGCSSFSRDWKGLGRAPASADPIEGPWEGTWKSHSSAHSDRLRCLLTRVSENQYEARFHAKYKRVLSFGYTASFVGVKTNDVFSFSGEADLGKLAGGVYRYEGKISPTNFFSTYDSKYDRGTFRLTQPAK